MHGPFGYGDPRMMRREELISVISSPNIHRGGGTEYALLITNVRIAGARKPAREGFFEAYLTAGAEATAADREAAWRKAAEIIGSEEFELRRDKIFQIQYEAPSVFF